MDAPLDQTPKVSSKQYSLNWQDLGRGLIMAVGGAILTVIETSLEAGNLHFNWKQIGVVGGTAACVYLMKNFFQPAVVQTPVTPKQVDDSTLEKTAK